MNANCDLFLFQDVSKIQFCNLEVFLFIRKDHSSFTKRETIIKSAAFAYVRLLSILYPSSVLQHVKAVNLKMISCNLSCMLRYVDNVSTVPVCPFVLGGYVTQLLYHSVVVFLLTL